LKAHSLIIDQESKELLQNALADFKTLTAKEDFLWHLKNQLLIKLAVAQEYGIENA
jgi:hypothetical protein